MLIIRFDVETKQLLSQQPNDPRMWLKVYLSCLHSKLIVCYRFHQKLIITHRNSILVRKLLIDVQLISVHSLLMFLNLYVVLSDLCSLYLKL